MKRSKNGKVRQQNLKNKQSGFGMTEMLIVVGIVMVVIIYLLAALTHGTPVAYKMAPYDFRFSH